MSAQETVAPTTEATKPTETVAEVAPATTEAPKVEETPAVRVTNIPYLCSSISHHFSILIG
jgi:hypothetical protein